MYYPTDISILKLTHILLHAMRRRKQRGKEKVEKEIARALASKKTFSHSDLAEQENIHPKREKCLEMGREDPKSIMQSGQNCRENSPFQIVDKNIKKDAM